MQIYGFQKTTLLDYPKHLASTIFVGGCNMRCPFCHNATLVLKPQHQYAIPKEEVLSTLSKRKNILEGVCISGGEPSLYHELPEFIETIKSLGLKVKLDTNGSNPWMLKSLVENKLIDYVAMDIKNSKTNYGLSVGIHNYDDISTIEESVSYLLSHPIDYEFRTTIVQEHHTESDILSIAQWLKGAKAYIIQPYQDSGDIIGEGLTSPSRDTLHHYLSILSPYIDYVALRGTD